MYDADTTFHPCDEHEEYGLLSTLQAHRRGLTSLQLSRATGLSTIVTIPMLGDLVTRGLVIRSEAGGTAASRRDWTYRVTASGRRLLSTASVPTHR